jgi:hypothetical protein
VFAFEVRCGSKEIDPLAGDEDFCRALVGDLFPSMRADFAAAPSIMTHSEAVGVCKLSRITALLLAQDLAKRFHTQRAKPC